MKTLNIEELSSLSGARIIDEGLVVVEDVAHLPTFDDENAVELRFVAAFYCQHGAVRLEVDGRPYVVDEEQMVCVFPTSMLRHVVLDDGTTGCLIAFTTDHLERYTHYNKELLSIIAYVKDHPLLKFTADDRLLVKKYFSLLHTILQSSDGEYLSRMAVFLMQSFIFQLANFIPSSEQEAIFSSGHLLSQDHLFNSFQAIVAKHNGSIRHVHEVARLLNVSSKYLSTVIMRVSGRKALDWIHEATYREIERQLLYTNRPIGQIARDLHFNTKSYFARFFRKKYHCTPAEYLRANRQPPLFRELDITF